MAQQVDARSPSLTTQAQNTHCKPRRWQRPASCSLITPRKADIRPHACIQDGDTNKNVKILIKKQNQELVQVLMVIVSYGSITGNYFSLFFSSFSIFKYFCLFIVLGRGHVYGCLRGGQRSCFSLPPRGFWGSN